MKFSFKKVVGVVLACLMLVSSMSAFACSIDDKGETVLCEKAYFVAYDELPDAWGLYGKIYKCPTHGVQRVTVDPEDVEWKTAFYEEEYPHRKIEVLVLEGNDTGLLLWDGETTAVSEGKVNTKEVAEFWEVKAPYTVYNRLYSDFVTGKFEPTTTLLTRGVTAPVERDWVYKGFDKYVIEDGEVKDYTLVYDTFANKVNFNYNKLDSLVANYWDAVSVDVNGAKYFTKAFVEGEATGAYDIFKGSIDNVSWLQLTGPDYATGGTKTVLPFEEVVEKDIPAEWVDNDLVITKNATTVDNEYLGIDYEDASAKVEWKVAGYELVAPYRYYEVLYVNGVPMDHSKVELKYSTVVKEEIADIYDGDDWGLTVVEYPVVSTEEVVDTYTNYTVTPFDTNAATYADTVINKEVIKKPEYETKVDEFNLNQYSTPNYEVRFVKKSTEPGKVDLPYIWRYTGECATPQIDWKVAFAEAAAPYEIYEAKWVKAMDGTWVETNEYRTTGRYAEDVPTVSSETGKPRILTVILKDGTDVNALKWDLEGVGYEYIIAGNRLNVIVPAELYDGSWGTDLTNVITKYVGLEWNVTE